MLKSNNNNTQSIDKDEAGQPSTRQVNNNTHGNTDKGETIKLYYKGTMSTAYKDDEKTLRDIVTKNTAPKNPKDQIKLITYYKSPSTSDLVISNNLNKDKSTLQAVNVVYEYHCPIGDCAHRSNSLYIGHTTNTLSRRMTLHLQDGAPKKHTEKFHKQKLTRSMIVDNTSIIARCMDRRRLTVLEAVYIRDRDPVINRQMNLMGDLSLYDKRLPAGQLK